MDNINKGSLKNSFFYGLVLNNLNSCKKYLTASNLLLNLGLLIPREFVKSPNHPSLYPVEWQLLFGCMWCLHKVQHEYNKSKAESCLQTVKLRSIVKLGFVDFFFFNAMSEKTG